MGRSPCAYGPGANPKDERAPRSRAWTNPMAVALSNPINLCFVDPQLFRGEPALLGHICRNGGASLKLKGRKRVLGVGLSVGAGAHMSPPHLVSPCAGHQLSSLPAHLHQNGPLMAFPRASVPPKNGA